jgi:diguanylate cyclase (GGDEF)-like protein/PAS domain S-box-containing protein
MIDDGLFRQAAMDSRDGITISDARAGDQQLVFANPAFERLTGYTAEYAIGRNCRYLQGDDHNQPEIAIMHDALARGEPCLVTLRNYRRDGTRFWNELSLSPIRSPDGELTHYVGIQKDVSNRVLLHHELRERADQLALDNRSLDLIAKRDRVTGIYNRRFFDDQLSIQWAVARRQQESISVFLVDLDAPAKHQPADPAIGEKRLREVADTLSQWFRRSADFVARYARQEFAILALGMDQQQADEYARRLCERVSRLSSRQVGETALPLSVNVGYKTGVPTDQDLPRSWLAQADQALQQAKLDPDRSHIRAN